MADQTKTKFVPLNDEQRAEIAPLGTQFNRWLVSLIDAIQAGAAATQGQSEDQTTLETLKRAIHLVTVVAQKPTVPLEHFAHQVGLENLPVICQQPERFILDYAPDIAYVQKLGVTREKWESYSHEVRGKVCKHVMVLGNMCNDFFQFLDTQRTQKSVTTTGKIPPEVLAAIKTMIPASMLAQAEQVPGGVEQLIQSVIASNPALLQALTGGPGDAQEPQTTSPAGLLDSFGPLFNSLKSQMGDLPDDATPEQRNDFYASIARWIGEQVKVEGSMISTMWGRFETAFPQGLTRRQIDDYIGRGRALLKAMGMSKSDAAWALVRKLVGFIDKMQDETKSSTLNRDTVADKVTSLVRLMSESEGGFEGLIETATESETLKGLVGSLTGLPIAEVARDPFSAAKRIGSGGPAFDLSSLSSILGGGGNQPTTPGGPGDDWSEDDA